MTRNMAENKAIKIRPGYSPGGSLRLNQSQFLNIGSSLCSLLDIRSITISGILIASVEEIVNNLSIILLVE